jgi:hypothetical protein
VNLEPKKWEYFFSKEITVLGSNGFVMDQVLLTRTMVRLVLHVPLVKNSVQLGKLEVFLVRSVSRTEFGSSATTLQGCYS